MSQTAYARLNFFTRLRNLDYALCSKENQCVYADIDPY